MEVTEDNVEIHVWPTANRGGQQAGTSRELLLIHVPSGLAVVMGGERSQMKNKILGMEKLRELVSLWSNIHV